MSFPLPKFSKTQVNQAGEVLRAAHSPETFNIDKWLFAYKVLSNWRVSHSYPINTFNATLRKKLKRIDPDALVAQRLKRTPSILYKLQRFPKMQLSRMQDIGGLRAIVGSVKELEELYKVYKSSKFTHELISEYDYVSEPKSSGYRSIHLVYKYHKKGHTLSSYNGFQIELQLRTKLQHIWATAVETVGTFLEHSLKSSEGPNEWLKFFALAGSAFAYLENTKQVPGFESLNKQETFVAITREAQRLGIKDTLSAYSNAVKAISIGVTNSAYYLVELNLAKDEKSVTVTTFTRENLQLANDAYTSAEERASNGEQIQVVLVSAGSIKSLKLAYPNYFLDTHDFLQQLKRIERLGEKVT